MLWKVSKVKNLSPKNYLKVKNSFVAFSILYSYKIEVILKPTVDIRSISYFKTCKHLS